jgi:NADPH2:quinone reductase
MPAAAVLRQHGLAPSVEIVAEPSPDEGQVLVDMLLAALNPVDLRVRDGDVAPDAPLPRVAGVEGVGRRDGKLVLVSGDGVGLWSDGTLAERVAVSKSALRPVPEGVEPAAAVCCSVVGATAARVVALAEVSAEDRVLVLGASGAVGQALCRLLHGRVRDTLGQVRSVSRVAAVEEACGRPILIESPADLAGLVEKEAPTVVLDALGGEWTSAALQRVPARTRLVLFGASSGTRVDFDSVAFYRRSLSVRGYSGMTEEPAKLAEATDEALAAVREGRLSFPVADCLPLGDVGAAYALMEQSETSGKVLVDLTEADV